MTERLPLFRPESLEARRLAWLGQPTVLGSVPLTLVAAFSVVFVLAVGLFVTFGEYTRRVKVSGIILPVDGLTRLAAPQAGWVTELRVSEGDTVERGDVLYVLSVDSRTELGSTQGDVIGILRRKREELKASLLRQAKLDEVQESALGDQVKNVERELAQVDSEIELLEEVTATLKEFVARQENFVSRGISISAAYESRLEAYNEQRVRLAMLRRERIKLFAELDEIGNRLDGFDLEAAARKGEIRRQVLDMDEQIAQSEAKRALQITAPRSGSVTGIVTLAGQTVTPGTPLLTIVPDERPLVAQLLAPSNAIGFVGEGDHVLLRYEAFPYQKFGQHPGTVSVISRTTLLPEEIARFNAGGVDPQRAPSLYRITVRPDRSFVTAYGRREPLQAGMQVEAHVMTDTRPLYQWILEPLYGLYGGVAAGRA